MDDSGKKCYNCAHLCRYYVMGEKQFEKTKYGWCKKRKKCEEIQGNCEKFENRKREKRVNALVKNQLHSLLVQITQIRQVIEETCDDKKL